MKSVFLHRRTLNKKTNNSKPYDNYQAFNYTDGDEGMYHQVPAMNNMSVSFWAYNEDPNFYNYTYYYYLDARGVAEGTYLTSNTNGTAWEVYIDGVRNNSTTLNQQVILNKWQRFDLICTVANSAGTFNWLSRYTGNEPTYRIKFADIRIYDRILTNNEIVSGNYQDTLLTNHYTFIGSTTTLVPDTSGNGRLATLYGTPVKSVTNGKVSGLLVHYQPSGVQLNGNTLTGWKNDATQVMTGITGNPFYISNDFDFNNQPSIQLNSNDFIRGTSVTGTDGLTIISVDNYPDNSSSGNGTMSWFMSCADGSLDLWSVNGQSTQRVLNSFNSEAYGFQIVDGTQSRTEVMTVCLPHNNTTAASFYRNGIFMPITQGSIPNRSMRNATIFPGSSASVQQIYSFEGKKSEFRVYNRVLLQSELRLIHIELMSKYLPAKERDNTLSPLTINEQDSRITFSGHWTLESHHAYIGGQGKYNQDSGYIEVTIPEGYSKVRFEGIVGQGGSTNYGNYQYYVNNNKVGDGSFTRNISSQFGQDVYFDITVQPGDIVRQTFGGTCFCDSITFYN